MPEKTPFCCLDDSLRKKFTSDWWRLQHITLRNPEQRQVAHQKYPAMCSMSRRLEPAQHCKVNANKDSVEDLYMCPYLEHVGNIIDSEFQPPPCPVLRTETYCSAGHPLSDHIAEAWKHGAQGGFERNIQNNTYYPFATHGLYNVIQCGIKTKGMKTHYDNVPKAVNTALCFPSFKNRDEIKKLVARIPGD